MIYGFHSVKGIRKQMEDAILIFPSLRTINPNLQLEIAYTKANLVYLVYWMGMEEWI